MFELLFSAGHIFSSYIERNLAFQRQTEEFNMLISPFNTLSLDTRLKLKGIVSETLV